jgi:hypothetical protein
MSKAELKAAIDADGGVKNQRSKHWDAAFTLHNSQPGVRRLKRGCGSCYRELYEWLSKV